MREVFRGWKRKLGVVTLAMACGFIIGWVRSLSVMDVLQIGSGSRTMEHCVSTNGSLIWGRFRTEDPNSVIVFPIWGTSGSSTIEAFLEHANLRCNWRSFGFGRGDLNIDSLDRSRHTFWMIPYWSIILPLTVLSAFLLLTKPRQSIPRKTADSIPKTTD
jgi:hypothetical protein